MKNAIRKEAPLTPIAWIASGAALAIGWWAVRRALAATTGPSVGGHVYVAPTEWISITDNRTVEPYSAMTREAQRLLVQLQYGIGPTGADGRLGPETRRALGSFQAYARLPINGHADAATMQALHDLTG